MDGCARVVAEAGAGGVTRLSRLFATGTISLWPLPGRAGGARVHLVSRAAGPIGGDAVRVDVEVGPRARLTVTSAAAAIALPGPDGAWSAGEVHASVAKGGFLCWRPQPLLVTAGAAHRSAAHVDVEDGGVALWWEELVLGRTGEAPGRLTARLSVDYAATPLTRHEVRVTPGWDSYARLGPYRAHVTACAAGVTPRWRDGATPVLSGTAAVLACDGPGLLVTAAGDDLAAARRLAAAGFDAAGAAVGRAYQYAY
ncbi:MAG: urease accessory protein UreD [Egibacteraceae bacterium]